jgi:prepilin-type N-terminal cleavage/methylation domain-containing protein
MDNMYNVVARRRRRGEGGFTLIELLVVIAVLAILAAIVIFNIVGVANKGKTSACNTDTQSVQTAVDAFQNDSATGAYPSADGKSTIAEAVTIASIVPAYIHTAPSANDGAFTFTDTSGTVKAGAC